MVGQPALCSILLHCAPSSRTLLRPPALCSILPHSAPSSSRAGAKVAVVKSRANRRCRGAPLTQETTACVN